MLPVIPVTYARLYILTSICFAIVPAAVVLAAPVHAETDDQALCASDDTADDRRVAACTAIITSGKLAGKELAVAYGGRAYALEGQQEFERALADVNQAILLEPASAEAFFRRGDIYKNLHQPDRAIEDFDAAIRLDPKVLVYFVNRSNAYLDRHDYDRALSDIDEALRLDPGDPGEAIVTPPRIGQDRAGCFGQIDKVVAAAGMDEAVSLRYCDRIVSVADMDGEAATFDSANKVVAASRDDCRASAPDEYGVVAGAGMDRMGAVLPAERVVAGPRYNGRIG